MNGKIVGKCGGGVGVEVGLGCVGEDDRDFVGGWDGVGRSWVSLMVSHRVC